MAIRYKRKVGSYLVLAMEGDFSIWDVSTMDEAFQTLTDNYIHYIAFDFSDVGSIHASILVPLLKLSATVRQFGGNIALCALPSTDQLILSVIKYDPAFQFYKSLESFIQAQSNSTSSRDEGEDGGEAVDSTPLESDSNFPPPLL